MRRRKIYITLHPEMQDITTLKMMIQCGINGFILSFSAFSPSAYEELVYLIQKLSFEMHVIPDLVIRLDSYHSDLLSFFARFHATGIILPSNLTDEEVLTIKKELTDCKLSSIELFSCLNPGNSFTYIMKKASAFGCLVLDRSMYDVSSYSYAEAFCEYHELLQDLSFAKIPLAVFCPITLGHVSESISEFSDLVHCTKSGARIICLDYRDVITQDHIPALNTCCDIIYAAAKQNRKL